ncbi:prephenate dehydrogenase [Actinobacteria bacterium YIM 96077]|uniref:Prephenate dehydrogenase n=1 Tax=Phytoactinopolyspora halophila TaxID=1981511 RepID=A0A329QYP4_9ACTN|nr:prephenate dehydrogenase [Phytoactinopolyspora halophila]AYY13227.1 prephenate dehydrogenase [Actinobacteria bacterium YIM 96077]RAW17534.1 prephenate dehydrogenase [Phytoactinopolyspora halophila]
MSDTRNDLESVLIVGAGLLGTSVGLALSSAGVDVRLRDSKPEMLAEAVRRGAGRPAEPDDQTAQLAVVAVPPEAVGEVVAGVLGRSEAEYATDVASVKVLPGTQVRAHAHDFGRYVGSHPMAGREISGPGAALPDLFEGRPWVICPDEHTHQQAVTRALSVARMVGAAPVTMTASEHDAAVALVSHVPHLVGVLMAARLVDAPSHQVRLAGPGIADVTRVAAGDPGLWTEILTANALAVRSVLGELRDDLDELIGVLDTAEPAQADLYRLMRAGVDGRSRLPGKHGAAHTEFATVAVVVDDKPGQLARLFADVGAAGSNVEDVRIDHSPGQAVGMVEIDVRPGVDTELRAALTARGWHVHA